MNNKLLMTGSAVLACVLSVSGTATAFANEVVAAKDEATLIASEEKAMNFATTAGTVSSIEKNEGILNITLSNENGDILVLSANDTEVLFDAETKTYISLENAKEGDSLTVILDENSPMTLSLPPIANNAALIIRTTGEAAVKVDYFDSELTSSDNNLVLNIGEGTHISNVNGAKMIYTAEDVKGSKCAVVYSFATLSLPAQTNPDAVIILENTTPTLSEVKTAALRESLEKLGYEVKWTGNDKPIVASKDGVSVSFTIGSNIATISKGDAAISYEMEIEAALADGVTIIDSSILDVLK